MCLRWCRCQEQWSELACAVAGYSCIMGHACSGSAVWTLSSCCVRRTWTVDGGVRAFGHSGVRDAWIVCAVGNDLYTVYTLLVHCMLYRRQTRVAGGGGVDGRRATGDGRRKPERRLQTGWRRDGDVDEGRHGYNDIDTAMLIRQLGRARCGHDLEAGCGGSVVCGVGAWSSTDA